MLDDSDLASSSESENEPDKDEKDQNANTAGETVNEKLNDDATAQHSTLGSSSNIRKQERRKQKKKFKKPTSSASLEATKKLLADTKHKEYSALMQCLYYIAENNFFQ